MISNTKYRVNNLAKDFNMKTKDLLDFFAKCGIKGKTSTAIIQPDEFALFLDRLTAENQTSDMSLYMAGKAYIPDPSKKIPENADVKKAPAPAEKKVEEKTTPVSTEKKAEEKIAPVSAEKRAEEKIAPVSAEKNAEKSAAVSDTSSSKKEKENAENKPQKNEKTQVQPERGASHSKERFVKPSFGTSQQKQAQKAPQKPQAPQNTQKRPQNTVQIKATLPGDAAPVRSTRIVDTRTTHVNLAKYDERLENFVPESSRRNNM
ncbi:MAG: hypothetical protein ACI4QR_01780, partial [Eubacteriales bacterium]